jgi:hypothetical protein
MNTLWVITLTLILLPIVALAINHIYVKIKLRKFAIRKLKRIEPLLKKLESKSGIEESEIIEMAKDPAFRLALYRALEAYNLINLFPTSYLTRERGAERFLVNWLEFPTELGKAPDEIELLEKITLPSTEPLDYYVFKFRTTLPHWAAQYGWMLGVCGPYRKQSLSYDVPIRVFSRFNGENKVDPEEEVDWVHTNIGRD